MIFNSTNVSYTSEEGKKFALWKTGRRRPRTQWTCVKPKMGLFFKTHFPKFWNNQSYRKVTPPHPTLTPALNCLRVGCQHDGPSPPNTLYFLQRQLSTKPQYNHKNQEVNIDTLLSSNSQNHSTFDSCLYNVAYSERIQSRIMHCI